jgi:hypothetical protein
MNKRKDLVGKLKSHYFWDVDLSKLQDEKGKRLIIERIINMGTLSEIMLLQERYGLDEVRRVLRNLNYIDPKTLNFISKLYNLPKKNFRCYTRKQLKPQHWNS